MNKTIKVSFSEQSKAVLADVTISYEGNDCPANKQVLQEAKDLFTEAQKYALDATFARNR